MFLASPHWVHTYMSDIKKFPSLMPGGSHTLAKMRIFVVPVEAAKLHVGAKHLFIHLTKVGRNVPYRLGEVKHRLLEKERKTLI